MSIPRLSVILVIHNMRRAAPRSLASLCADYQRHISASDYEILVIENGSDEPLGKEQAESLGGNIHYHYLENPPPSPAYAINYGVRQARGEVLALMVDGAHMLSPGVLHHGLSMFDSLANPLVVTLPFFLGPGPQYETIFNGYNEQQEDQLLEDIDWPSQGYALFDISTPYRIEPGGVRPKHLWLVRQFESNCLFCTRRAFEEIDGCDERFDIPGGGIMLPDLYLRLCQLEETDIVQLLGEASFHQLHGGTSTNVNREQQKEKWQTYLAQYENIRGLPYSVSQEPLRFFGHMPNEACRRLMETG